jgi:hypothetical protein
MRADAGLEWQKVSTIAKFGEFFARAGVKIPKGININIKSQSIKTSDSMSQAQVSNNQQWARGRACFELRLLV